MGIYVEFYMINLLYCSDWIKKIKAAQEQSLEILEKVLEEFLSPLNASTKKRKVIKPSDVLNEDKTVNWKWFIGYLKPRYSVSTLNIKAMEMFCELATELELDECWTDEEQFEELVSYHTTFRDDLMNDFNETYRKKDQDGEYVELNEEETEKLTQLWRMTPYHNLLSATISYNNLDDEQTFTFIHPSRVQELSEKFNHSTRVPKELLKASFQERYDEYLNAPEKKKAKKEKETKMTIEEFIEHNMEVDTFDEILKHYNTPKIVFSLIDRPIMDPPGPVTTICTEELHTDYWISIMDSIGDPFTLTRLAMTCSKLYKLFQEKKIELFQEFKKDIGFFVYMG